MIFKRVAKGVIRHHKKILVIWIVVFLISGYLAMFSGDVIIYEDSEMAPPDIESARADGLIGKEFMDQPNSTAIVVIQHDDIRSVEVTHFILNLEGRIKNESSAECTGDALIRCFDSITTVYSIYRDVINATAASLAPTIHGLEANVTGLAFMIYGLPYIFVSVHEGIWAGVNGSAFMVYGIPSSFLEAREGVNQTAMLLYGLPSMFAQTWDGVNSSAMLLHGLPSMYAEAWDGVNGSAMMMYGLPSMFAEAWDGVNGSAMMMYGLPSMFAGAWSGTNSTAFTLYGIPYMFKESWDGTNQTANLLYGGPAAYMGTWVDLAPFYTDVNDTNREAFNQSWDILNASIEDEVTRQMMYGYHYEFYQYWNRTFNMTDPAFLDPLTVMPDARAQEAVDNTAPTYFNFSVPVNTTQEAMYGVWSSFNVTNFNNRTLMNDYVNSSTWALLEKMTAGLDIEPEQMQMFDSYYGTFTDTWKATFLNTSMDNLTAEERTQYVIDVITLPFIDQVSGTNDTMRGMMLGVLDYFDLDTWGNETHMNIFTNQSFYSMMQAMVGGLGLSPEMAQQLWMYYDMWYGSWNATFQNLTLTGLSHTERAWLAVNTTAPSFIQRISAIEPQAGPMLEAVRTSFDLTNWGNVSLVNDVTNSTFYGTMQSMAGMFSLPPDMEQLLWSFYDGLYEAWSASFEVQGAVFNSSVERAEASLLSFAPGFIDMASQGNESMGAMLQGILTTFNTTTWENVTLINRFSRSFFADMIDSMATDMGVPASQAQGMFAYFELFADEWDLTFDDISAGYTSSLERAEVAVQAAGPGYISQASGGDPLTSSLLTGVLTGFNSSNWDNISMVNAFSERTFSSSLGPMMNEYGVPAEQVEQLERYYQLFMVHWNASFNLPPLMHANSTKRADYAAQASGPELIDEVAAGNETIKASMLGVLNGLDLDSWDDTGAIDSHTYLMMLSMLDSMGAEMGLDEQSIEKARDLLTDIYDSWTYSYSEPGLEDENISSPERMVWVIDDAIPRYVASLSGEEAMFISKVYEGLTLKNWYDTYSQEVLANRLSYEMASGMLDDIMANMTGDVDLNDTMRYQITEYLNVFYNGWNWSFNSSAEVYIAGGTDPLIRAKMVVDEVAPVFFGFDTVDDEASRFMHDIWSSFGPSNWSDLGEIHNFTIRTMISSLSDNSMTAMTYEPELFEAIYALGPNPTAKQVETFTDNIIWHGTLDSYPIKLSPDIVSSFINEKNDTMLIVIGFNKGTGSKYGPKVQRDLDSIKTMIKASKKETGLTGVKAFISGPAPLSLQLEESIDKDIHRIDIVTAIVVVILISLFFRSFVTSGIPLMTMGAAIVATYGIIFLLGAFVLQIHYTVITLAFTALMGAGIDYCIFIIARFREERMKGVPKVKAIELASTWAGESITTSGMAVMIGFGGLSILPFSMVQGMGVVLPIGIGIAILVALTFLPSLMMLLGDRIFWPLNMAAAAAKSMKGKMKGPKGKEKVQRKAVKRRKKEMTRTRDGAEDDGGSVFYFTNAVNFATKNAKAIIIVAMLVSIPTTWLVMSLETSYDFFSGMPDNEATRGFDAMAEGFGKSRGMETKVVIDVDGPVYDASTGTYDVALLDAVDRMSAQLTAMDAIQRVDPSTYIEGERIDTVDCWQTFGDEYKDSCLQRSIGRSNQTIVLTVVLKEEPFSKESIDSIQVIREKCDKIKRNEPALSETSILVGGATAGMSDIEGLIESNMGEMRIIVVVMIFILLVVVLGSILIPITAIISIGLSISWTLAVTMLVFEYVRDMTVMWLMPIILFVVLMGLGMDYNIFIITRMREEVLKGYSDKVAIRRAVERTGGIITACGAIMAGAFGSMMLSAMGMLQQFGFALFFAIMLDAFVIRIYLMPAIIVLLKKWNWWAPGRLQRVKRDENGRVLIRGEAEKGTRRRRVLEGNDVEEE